MRMAAAATCEHDRLKWLRVAQAWQDLGSVHAERRWLNDHSRVPIWIGLPATTPGIKREMTQPRVTAPIVAQDN